MNNKLLPTYEKKTTCLHCQQIFSTVKIRSRFVRVDEVDRDFYQSFKDPDLNPYYYEVDVCPSCGFAFTESFSADFSVLAKKRINRALKNWREQDFCKERSWDDAVRALKLALLSAIMKQEKHIVIGGLALRLAWLYRMNKIHDQEQRFLKEALKHYKLSYEHADYLTTKMSDIRLLYIIGELARRVEEIDDAIMYFSRVIQHKDREREPKIMDMAREQWQYIRNEKERSSYS